MPGNVTIPQPGVPYMKMRMGGEDVTFGEDRRLLSFSYDMVTNKTNSVEVVFLDTEWTYIEGLLADNWADGIEIEFGWLGSNDSKLWTKEPIKMQALKFNPQVFDSYVTIAIKGSTLAPRIAEAGSNPLKDYATQRGYAYLQEDSISGLVKKMFKDLKIDTEKVEETAKLALAHVSVDDTLATVPNYLITSQTPIQILVNEWIKRAIEPGDNINKLAEEIDGKISGSNNKGRGGYTFHFIDTKPPQIVMTIKGDKSIFATYDYPTQHKGAREVISFSYEVDIMAAVTYGQLSTKTDFIDPHSGASMSVTSSAEVKEEGAKGIREFSPKGSHGVTAAASRQIYPGVTNTKQLIEANQALYWTKENQIRRGGLVLLGRPDYLLGHRIQMNVWLSRMTGGKSSPEPHYSSGEWQVFEVRQKITPGEFLTTLDLKKITGVFSTPQTGGATDKKSKETFTIGEEGGKIPHNTELSKAYYDDQNSA